MTFEGLELFCKFLHRKMSQFTLEKVVTIKILKRTVIKASDWYWTQKNTNRQLVSSFNTVLEAGLGPRPNL